jgi:hypothetical protein
LADDYYEDVLAQTKRKMVRKQRKKQLKKGKSSSWNLKKGKQLNVKKVGTGPWALLWRAKVEDTRNSIHPYISMTTVVLFLAALMISFFVKTMYIEAANFTFYMANGIVAYVLFLFNMALPMESELQKPYLYLIPGSNMKKMIAVIGLDIIRITVSMIVFNGILVWMLPISLVLAGVTSAVVVSFYTLSVCSKLLARLLFPNAADQKMLYPLFMLAQTILLLVPGIIVGIIIGTLFQSVVGGFLGIGIINILLISVFILLGDIILGRMELR